MAERRVGLGTGRIRASARRNWTYTLLGETRNRCLSDADTGCAGPSILISVPGPSPSPQRLGVQSPSQEANLACCFWMKPVMLSSFQEGKLLLTSLSMTNWNLSARTKQPRRREFSILTRGENCGMGSEADCPAGLDAQNKPDLTSTLEE